MQTEKADTSIPAEAIVLPLKRCARLQDCAQPTNIMRGDSTICDAETAVNPPFLGDDARFEVDPLMPTQVRGKGDLPSPRFRHEGQPLQARKPGWH